jgi:hypothetical protein
LVEAPEKRPVFPEAAVGGVQQFRDALGAGPSAVSYVVLLYDPCNAEALMQLAETAAQSQEPTLGSLVQLWARRAVELSKKDPAMEHRKQIVEQKMSESKAGSRK